MMSPRSLVLTLSFVFCFLNILSSTDANTAERICSENYALFPDHIGCMPLNNDYDIVKVSLSILCYINIYLDIFIYSKTEIRKERNKHNIESS